MRIYLWVSLGGLVLLGGLDAVVSLAHSGLGVLAFYLAMAWTFGCLVFGFALLVAWGIRRFARRVGKRS